MTPKTPAIPKILCVDDDSNVLAGLVRTLRRRYSLDVALGPETGLTRLAANGPYAVVVCDMNMPGMDGVRFLARACEIAPDTVRMMLTGHASVQTAVDALHHGHVFRFLIKPTPPEALADALDAGLAQYKQVCAEKDLMGETLQGVVRVLVEILSTVAPESFDQSQSMRERLSVLMEALGLESTWEIEIIGLLSQIGLVTVPPTLVQRARTGCVLTPAEQDVLRRAPEAGANLLANVPRLAPVARAIRYSGKNFDGTGWPIDGPVGADLPLGSRLLRLLSGLDEMTAGGMREREALVSMQRHADRFDPRIVAAALKAFENDKRDEAARAAPAAALVAVEDVKVGQTLAAHVTTEDGKLLIPSGSCLTASLLERLRNFANMGLFKGLVRVEREVS